MPSWLTVTHGSFGRCVSNRVCHIQTALPNCNWRHVFVDDDFAICTSRGFVPSGLPSFLLYWRGPQFIYDFPDEWGSNGARILWAELTEVWPMCCITLVDEVPGEWCSRFSSCDRMLQVASMHRFVECCQNRTCPCLPSLVSHSNLDNATRLVVIESQRIHLAFLFRELVRRNRVLSKPSARLTPFLGADGVIRVGSCLRHSRLVYDCKHPVLVAKRSHFAQRLCRRRYR